MLDIASIPMLSHPAVPTPPNTTHQPPAHPPTHLRRLHFLLAVHLCEGEWSGRIGGEREREEKKEDKEE